MLKTNPNPNVGVVFPDNQEWIFYKSFFPETSIDSLVQDIFQQIEPRKIENFDENSVLIESFHKRLNDLKFTYTLLVYYYHKVLEPTNSIDSYYNNILLLHQFHLFADYFYYKIFSAWDGIGHLLNLIYDLGFNKQKKHRISFESISKNRKLKKLNPELYKELSFIYQSVVYRKAKFIRNHFTHNQLPYLINLDFAVHYSEHSEISSVNSDSNLNALKQNIDDLLDLFVKSLSHISSHFAAQEWKKNKIPIFLGEM